MIMNTVKQIVKKICKKTSAHFFILKIYVNIVCYMSNLIVVLLIN